MEEEEEEEGRKGGMEEGRGFPEGLKLNTCISRLTLA